MSSEFHSRVSLLETGGDQVLTLEGTIDAFSASELLGAARRSVAGSGRVVVACNNLERLDSCALQVLLSLRKTLDERQRPLELVELSGPVLDFVRLGGAEELLFAAATSCVVQGASTSEFSNTSDREIDGE